jgi:AhpD family alkylhydroperoxidase
MSQRINYVQQSPSLVQKLAELGQACHSASIEHALIDLINVRASQINGCAFCVDMHVKEAKIRGERELRLHHVVIWRESPLFSARERAALEWTEAVTKLGPNGVPDSIFEQTRAHFSEKELSDLTFVVLVINAWNRLAVPFRSVPGSADRQFGIDKAGLS